MSDVVARVQRAILLGVGEQEVHDALAALRIEGGREPKSDALERVRRCVLYAGCTEQEMRDAFSDVGNITGTDPAETIAAVRGLLLRHLKRVRFDPVRIEVKPSSSLLI